MSSIKDVSVINAEWTSNLEYIVFNVDDGLVL